MSGPTIPWLVRWQGFVACLLQATLDLTVSQVGWTTSPPVEQGVGLWIPVPGLVGFGWLYLVVAGLALLDLLGLVSGPGARIVINTVVWWLACTSVLYATQAVIAGPVRPLGAMAGWGGVAALLTVYNLTPWFPRRRGTP